MTLPAMRPVEGFANGRETALWRLPCFLVYFGFECGFEGLVRVVGAEEIGVADEEAFSVVVGVNEPAGDALRVGADDFTGLWFEDVHDFDAHLDLILADGLDVSAGSAGPMGSGLFGGYDDMEMG
jgi:hypothetical protein